MKINLHIVSKYLFDLSNDEIKKHISDIYLLYMKDISKSYLSKKINKLNKKIH